MGIVGSLSSGDRVEVDQFFETVLRVAVEADERGAVERFSRELMPFITAGPQGTTGYAEGRPRVHPVVRYWPCLIDRDALAPFVEMIATEDTYVAIRTADELLPSETVDPRRGGEEIGTDASQLASHRKLALPLRESPVFSHPRSERRLSQSEIRGSRPTLYDVARARSGDKGSNANVGVIARNGDAWEFLHDWLTTNRVAEYFSPLEVESVERFVLPNLQALNFVLRGVLRCSLRTDAQGKTLGQILLEMPLPAEASRMIPVDER
jgi:hypothetical protein